MVKWVYVYWCHLAPIETGLHLDARTLRKIKISKKIKPRFLATNLSGLPHFTLISVHVEAYLDKRPNGLEDNIADYKPIWAFCQIFKQYGEIAVNFCQLVRKIRFSELYVLNGFFELGLGLIDLAMNLLYK